MRPRSPYVAPSNLITLLDAIPPYWEAGRKQMYTRMADPTTPEGKALLVAESPLTQAKAIVTPLMVVQGKNDPRVNIRESDQIVAAVRDNGKPVEYLVAPDEGHGFARPINNLAMVTAMEEFFAQYLGGRYQKDVPHRRRGQAQGNYRRSQDGQRGGNPEGSISNGAGEVDEHCQQQPRHSAAGCCGFHTTYPESRVIATATRPHALPMRVVFGYKFGWRRWERRQTGHDNDWKAVELEVPL